MSGVGVVRRLKAAARGVSPRVSALEMFRAFWANVTWVWVYPLIAAPLCSLSCNENRAKTIKRTKFAQSG
ncbi:hypothetical protein V6Z12_A02G021700 [Gossypium hirsutum]